MAGAMNCTVCGKDFSLWARFTGDADDAVCRDCEQEGPKRLQSIVNQVSPTANLYELVKQFERTANKFRIPPEKRIPLGMRFLETFVVCLADKPDLNETDVEHLNDLANKLQMHSVTFGSAIGSAVTKINAREAVREWEAGKPPATQCKGLLLNEYEICHWEEPAKLLEQRTRREYVGGYGGVSVRIARGVRIHSGGFRGHPIETEYLADCGLGQLHITSSRICFTGSQRAVSVPFKKIISVHGFEDGFQFFRTGAKKPVIFQVPHPDLTLQLMALATPATND